MYKATTVVSPEITGLDNQDHLFYIRSLKELFCAAQVDREATHGAWLSAMSDSPQGEAMGTVTSKDGTRITYDQSGAGPAIILVVGAFNDRATGAPLARFLEQHFTMFNMTAEDGARVVIPHRML